MHLLFQESHGRSFLAASPWQTAQAKLMSPGAQLWDLKVSIPLLPAGSSVAHKIFKRTLLLFH